MQLNFPFDTAKPVVGEASRTINLPPERVFSFVAENFFENYPRWATEVAELEPAPGTPVRVGLQGRQVRRENDSETASLFEVTDFDPYQKFAFRGLDSPYKHTYLTRAAEHPEQTHLTFVFELSELEVFMRPFVKLIRAAIEEGAEAAVGKIEELLLA